MGGADVWVAGFSGGACVAGVVPAPDVYGVSVGFGGGVVGGESVGVFGFNVGVNCLGVVRDCDATVCDVLGAVLELFGSGVLLKG